MKIYIASSWKNQHAVELLTARLRDDGYEVLSFVENNQEEGRKPTANFDFDSWVWGQTAAKCFLYDTAGATKSDLVIYIGPSGSDAWAEVGAAWANGIPILGLWAKGEQSGLMRKMVTWKKDYRDLLESVRAFNMTGNLS